METIIDKLAATGISPQQPLSFRKVLSVKENGKEYRLTMNPEMKSASYQVDGSILKVGNRCDKLVVVEKVMDGWTEIFVELKGKDISHAIEQLESTMCNPLFKHVSVVDIRARIVGQSIPRNTGSSILERAKVNFIKRYRCDLRAASGVYKEDIRGTF